MEKTLDHYTSVFGIDRPETIITGPAEESQIRFRGETTPARAKLAFIRFSNITLELIEPVDGPSVWREFLDSHGEGVHHIAFQVKGMQSTVDDFDSRGVPLSQKGEYTGGRYAYLDAADKLGVDIELLEND